MGLTESGHWYDQEGRPQYTIKGANGKIRNTTLRDARKMKLVPSVTTVEKVIAAPQLTNWMVDQAIMAAMTCPRPDGMTDEEYVKLVKDDSREQAKQAAELGSSIHGAIELYLTTGKYPEEYRPHVEATWDIMLALAGYETDEDPEGQQWYAEQSFTHKVLGFGGKVDAIYTMGDGIVADFKTKAFDHDSLPRGWDNHARQLAAYRQGLNMPKAKCYNIFISTSVPGLVHVHEWKEEEIRKGGEQFVAALGLWKALKGYDSGDSK